MRKIRVHVIRTGYPHWHGHSALNAFHQHFNPTRFQIQVHIAPDSDDDFPTQNRVVRGALRMLVQFRGMQWYKLSDLTAEVRALHKCWRGDIDVLHYLEGEHSAQYLPLLLARLPRLRPAIMATFHQPPDLLPQLLRPEVIAKLDQVTVVSPEQVPFFQEVLPPDRVNFIPHGINTEYFQPPVDRDEPLRFRCITVGHWLRDYDALRKVATLLGTRQEIEFHVVSPRVAGLDELPNVTMHSNLSDASLRLLYQTSDVLVLPLLASTANNALMEGIACGLPVISTDLSSVRAYVPGREAILIRDNDPGEIADALLYLIKNSAVRLEMGRHARARAEELSWKRVVLEYERLYQELLGLELTGVPVREGS